MGNRGQEFMERNRREAARPRPLVAESKQELEQAAQELLEAQARRDAALDHHKKLSDRLHDAEANSFRVPLSVGHGG